MKRFLWLFLWPISAISQDPVKRVINSMTGLPSNTVYDIIQDQKGFIWIGHDKGLCRYDGNVFVPMKGIFQQGKAVTNLMEHKGIIWCQDFAGNFYFTRNDSLIAEPLLHSRTPYYQASIIKDHLLVSASGDSMVVFNIDTRQKQRYLLHADIGQCGIRDKDEIIIPCGKHLHIFDGEKLVQQENEKGMNFTYLVFKVNKQVFGISRVDKPYVYNISSDQTVQNSLPSGLFIQGLSQYENEVWLATSTGVYCFDNNIKPSFGTTAFYQGTNFSHVLKDREGNYWFGTLNRGIYFVPNLGVRLFKHNNAGITALQKPSDIPFIIAGTENNELLRFDNMQSPASLFQSGTNHEVVAALFDPEENIFYECSDQFYVVDANGHIIHQQPLAGKSMAIVSRGVIAIATSSGISLYARNAQAAMNCWLIKSGKKPDVNGLYNLIPTATRARSVAYSEADSTLYAATINGLFYFSPSGNGEIKWKDNAVYANHLSIGNNLLYAATQNDGVLEILKRQVTRKWDKQSGLLSNTIYKVQALPSELWLTTGDVLQKIDKATGQVFTYDYTDGMPQAEIKDLLVDSSRVYAATPEGLVLFNKNIETKNTVTPRLQLSALTANNIDITNNPSIRLSAKQNNINILFSVLSFKGADKIIVRYRINEGNWQPVAPGLRNVSLPLLSPGRYRIELQAFNEDGIGEEMPLSISFQILQPWYKRLWFLALAGVIIFSLLFFIYKARVRSIQRNNKLEADKLRLEQDVQQSVLAGIKSQMNPHFLFNALNTIQSYIYQNDKENASLYLGKFSQLTRKILDMSNRDIISLSEELEMLELYLELEQQRFDESMKYIITVEPGLNPETVYMPSMLIQPFVENAIKHGLLNLEGEKLVSVTCEKKDDILKVTIDDNGVGREKAAALQARKRKEHQSFATGANSRRLDILNRQLKNTIAVSIFDKVNHKGEPAGTTVVLSIPLNNSIHQTNSHS